MNAGKWLILGILSAAIVAGAAAWAHRYYRTDEVQAFWGPQTLDLIANAPRVEAIARIGDKEIKRLDVTDAKGMLNIRYMLASDFSYRDLLGTPPSVMVPAPWALEFHRGKEVLRLGLHHDRTLLLEETGSKSAVLVDAAARNMRSFLDEQLPDEAIQIDKLWKPSN